MYEMIPRNSELFYSDGGYTNIEPADLAFTGSSLEQIYGLQNDRKKRINIPGHLVDDTDDVTSVKRGLRS
jgi:hypothetical protein